MTLVDLIQRLAENFLDNLHLVIAFLGFWSVDLLAQYRLRLSGMQPRSVAGLTPRMGIGALVGARIIYLLPTPSVFYQYPVDLVRVNAGLSFHGALIGAFVALLLYRRLRGVSLLSVADAYALFLPVAIALYRLSCFLHGTCWGTITDTFMGVRFPGLTIPRYPSELYEGFLVLGLFAALFQISLRRPRPGLLFATFLLGYAIVRGLVDLTRIQVGFWAKADPWLAVAMALVGLIALWTALRRPRAIEQGRRHSRRPSPRSKRRGNAT